MKLQTVSNISNLYDTLNSIALIPQITKLIKVTDEATSLFENILTTLPQYFVSGKVTFDISDHFSVFRIYKNYFVSETPATVVNYRLVNEVTLTNVRETSIDLDLERIVIDVSCDVAINKGDNILINEIDKACPILTGSLQKGSRETLGDCKIEILLKETTQLKSFEAKENFVASI